MSRLRPLAILLLLPVAISAGRLGPAPDQAPPPASFAARIEALSEPPGYFDTDNLISNERSYLHVIPALQQAKVRGGAYIGVGPDQNFSYIAQIRPAIAFVVDIRRDNLLLHLLFKGLFALAGNRAEYLSLLTGRPVPSGAEWRDAGVERLVAYIDGRQPAADAGQVLKERLQQTIRRFGVPLSAGDLETLERFHRAFIEAGLSLRFQTLGRASRAAYPTYRDLVLETDRSGKRWSFLASEDSYEFVRSLEGQDLVIPVVGDLSGAHAVRAVADLLADRGERLSAFYVSNVEDYLFRSGSFGAFVENLRRLPRSDQSVIIRSIFDGSAGPRGMLPGYLSTSVVQPVNRLLSDFSSGKYRSYWDLVSVGFDAPKS